LLLGAVLRPGAVAPLLLSARRPPSRIDISCSHGAQQQTRHALRRRRVMGQTDGQRDEQGYNIYTAPAYKRRGA